VSKWLSGIWRHNPELATFVPVNPTHYIREQDAVRAMAQSEIAQLKFLLACAPMIEIPADDFSTKEFPMRVTTPFAYIHPKTMARMTFQPVLRHCIMFPRTQTKWVLTSLMPEGRVICSPLPIPGLEKILAE
jgi:hypothetical protein